jgi:Rod binding domain-containing protein
MMDMQAPAYAAPPFAPPHVPEQPRPDGARTTDADTLRARAREQAREFESVFLTMFVQEMFSGLDTEGEFSGGHAEGIYRSMMSEQYADTIARSGGIGLADHVYAEIMKAQQIEP